MFQRPITHAITDRMQEPRRFIQVLIGPRQVGKTTLAQQVIKDLGIPSRYASADEPTLKDASWLREQWEIARHLARENQVSSALLVLDEIQKLPDWSAIVKGLWDEDTRLKLPLKVMLLGSSPLLVHRGLSESLAGRFEVIRVPHWSFQEMRDAFGWDLETYIYYGGYPGAATLIADRDRWTQYIRESLIETTISRDILLLTRIDKPALLRRLFLLSCNYSGRILSYQKMLGQLDDAGNTTTLAHYLKLLEGAGMVMGLAKFAGEQVRRRASSPKLLAFNTALITAQSGLTLQETRDDPPVWGHLVESTVGAHLINNSLGTDIEVFYWREGSREVDFVLKRGSKLTAIEVKSAKSTAGLSGTKSFIDKFHPSRTLLIGPGGTPLSEFLLKPLFHWL